MSDTLLGSIVERLSALEEGATIVIYVGFHDDDGNEEIDAHIFSGHPHTVLYDPRGNSVIPETIAEAICATSLDEAIKELAESDKLRTA